MMTEALPPINTLVREIDTTRWLIGKNIIIALEPSVGSGPSWSDGRGSFYNIAVVSDIVPNTREIPASSEIQKIHDAGGTSAVWSFGQAFCKIKLLDPGATREHVTLAYLKSLHEDISFSVPEVYYHAEIEGLYYLFLSRVPGTTLSNAWPGMDATAKDQIVSRVVDICAELGRLKSNQISGVDGNYLPDHYLLPRGGHDLSPESLLCNSRALGMDCSTFLLYHCDLGPGNIMVDDEGRLLGIIDWETVGFVPKEWIRTKFRISAGMDLPGDDLHSRSDWRKRVQLKLGTHDYPEVAERWSRWFGGDY